MFLLSQESDRAHNLDSDKGSLDKGKNFSNQYNDALQQYFGQLNLQEVLYIALEKNWYPVG